MKKIICLMNILLALFVVSCSQTPNTDNFNPEITSLDIIKDTVSLEEIDVFVGDKFSLSTALNENLTANVVWVSSNETIAKVDANGNVDVLAKGNAVISAYVDGMPYISDSIFLSSTRKVGQIDVGSGLSKDDPIFLGNEGEEEPIEVYFIEMRHIYADSIFIKKGNVEVLIDSGYEYDGDLVKKIVTQYCPDNRLDVLMISHSDADHIDGLNKALENVENISLMIDYGGRGSGNVLKAREKYTQKDMVYHSAIDCVNGTNGAVKKYYLTEDFYFEVLDTGNYISNTDTSASNGESLAVIFYYKDFSFFTAGDLTTASEKDLLKNEDLPEVTLYKASHHGSNGSNSQEILDALNPKAVAISAARANQFQATPTGPDKNNTYNLDGKTGHPYSEAIKRIYQAPNISKNLNVYWNAVNGTMKFTSYGENDFIFTGSTPLKGYYDLTLTNGVAVWNDQINDFENRVTGEENFRLHETKMFQFRNYVQYLPAWAKEQYFPNN